MNEIHFGQFFYAFYYKYFLLFQQQLNPVLLQLKSLFLSQNILSFIFPSSSCVDLLVFLHQLAKTIDSQSTLPLVHVLLCNKSPLFSG